MPQEGPNRPLERPKMAPRDPQSVKIASKKTRNAPQNGGLDGHDLAQKNGRERAKEDMSPRMPQEGPREAQDRPKRVPRASVKLQKCPKLAQNRHLESQKIAPRVPNGI